MTFEQVDGKKNQVKITDSLNYGTETEQSFATIVDIEKGTQCKLTLDTTKTSPVAPTEPKKGDESSFVPVDTDDDKPVATPATPATPAKPVAPIDPSKPINPSTPNPGQSPGQSPGQKPVI